MGHWSLEDLLKKSRQIFTSLKVSIILLLLLPAVAVTYLAVDFNVFLKTPLIATGEKNTFYYLKPGASVRTVAADLYQQGLLDKPYYFVLLAYWQGVAHRLQVGEYQLVTGTLPQQLLAQFTTGKVVYHTFTIVEGWNFQQLLTALHNTPYLQHTLQNLPPEKIVKTLSYLYQDPEGLFFPDTYHVALYTKDTTLLEKAYRTMVQRLQSEWKNRAPYLPYTTPYEALIAASIIERESANSFERPLIAGVLLQRLQKGMPLQIDATVIYGVRESYTGALTKNHLRTDTLYNTYTRKGLPPTPIAMPSRDAIVAALHPIRTAFLYFVARGDGTHHFSTTLAEHHRAVAHYRKIRTTHE